MKFEVSTRDREKWQHVLHLIGLSMFKKGRSAAGVQHFSFLLSKYKRRVSGDIATCLFYLLFIIFISFIFYFFLGFYCLFCPPSAVRIRTLQTPFNHERS